MTFILNILILFISLKIQVNSLPINSVSISYNVLESRRGSSNIQIIIKNNGLTPICSVKFFLSLPNGSVTQSNRSMRLRGNNKYRTPKNVRIEPGSSFNDAGLIIKGNGKPTLYILNVTECNNKNEDNDEKDCTTTTESSGKNKGNEKIKTTTESNENNDKITKSNKGNNKEITTTTESSGNNGGNNKDTTDSSIPSNGNTLIVDPDRGVAKNMCLSLENASGVIDPHLDTPISDGIFTFYGAGGQGACGIDSATPKMSAAVSAVLFDSNAKWINSCYTGHEVRNDKVCINKCVTIEYHSKTLTVPITNECPECPLNHVDLSREAFDWLEPKDGIVGRATGATITYKTCRD
ncbi:hypothetical protein ACQ4LE_003299 [Meloidogyne hapla]|uniref:DPBB_1 domain-containing protein n=1 Tax=Meloidogyne hapla TaxID=6305 RepID=A0A1I8BYM5_MELHA